MIPDAVDIEVHRALSPMTMSLSPDGQGYMYGYTF